MSPIKFTPGIYCRGMKTYILAETLKQVLIAALFIATGDNPNAYQLENEKIKYKIFIQWYLFNNKKEETTNYYNNDELQGIMLSERGQAQNTSCYVIPFIWNLQKR